MEIDYDSAMSRVSRELDALVEDVWPSFMEAYKRENILPEHPRGEKSKTVEWNARLIADEQKRKRLLMLGELSRGRYWHADDNWSEVCNGMGKEDKEFYAQLMIEQAKKDNEGKRLGYIWIVKSYDNGRMKEFIPEDLLKDAVNRGFLEFANMYFTGAAAEPPFESYDNIMKYKKFLDLTKVNELRKSLKEQKPLKSERDWIDGNYIECFNKAKSKLSVDDAAWFARPIVEDIIKDSISNPDDSYRETLEKRTKPYSDYFEAKIIQDMLKEFVEFYVSDLDSTDNAYDRMKCIDALSIYVKLTEDELKDFVSSRLPEGINAIKNIVDIDLPKKWLNADALSQIEKGIINYLSEPESKSIIPHLSFIQDSVGKGFLDENIGREKIIKGLRNYLGQKRRPGGKSVEDMLASLNPKYVDADLYKNVVERAVEDLRIRKRAGAADKWSGKLQEIRDPTIKIKEEKNETNNEIEKQKQDQTRIESFE